MAYIDWTDAEGLFGMLVEFIAAEKAGIHDDPERERFLNGLIEELEGAHHAMPDASVETVIDRLQGIEESLGHEFHNDPVMEHLRSCVEELEGLR